MQFLAFPAVFGAIQLAFNRSLPVGVGSLHLRTKTFSPEIAVEFLSGPLAHYILFGSEYRRCFGI